MTFRTLILAAIAGLAGWTGKAGADAWPRGEGDSFLSFSLERPVDGSGGGTYASLYYEYGLTPRLTFGIDAGRDLLFSGTSAIVFLRYPVFSGGSNKFAIELGLGSADSGGRSVFTVRPGLSWGRGYTAAWGTGWMGVDATYQLRSDGTGLGKVDATIGANHANGALSMLQLQFERPTGKPHEVAIAPSHVFKLSDRTYLQLGLRHQIRTDVTSAKLAIWVNF